MRWRSALSEDLALAGHGDDAGGALFRPVKNNVTGELDSPLNPNSDFSVPSSAHRLATACALGACRFDSANDRVGQRAANVSVYAHA